MKKYAIRKQIKKNTYFKHNMHFEFKEEQPLLGWNFKGGAQKEFPRISMYSKKKRVYEIYWWSASAETADVHAAR